MQELLNGECLSGAEASTAVAGMPQSSAGTYAFSSPITEPFTARSTRCRSLCLEGLVMLPAQIQVIFTELLTHALICANCVLFIKYSSVLYVQMVLFIKLVHGLISMSISVLQTKQCPSALAKKWLVLADPFAEVCILPSNTVLLSKPIA